MTMEVLLLTEQSRPGPGRWLWLLLVLAGLGLLAAAGIATWSRHQAAAAAPARRAEGPAGLLVPSPNDGAWTEYYRNRRDGVSMAEHLPVARHGDQAVVWQKYVEQARALVAVAEVHYDCGQGTRRSVRMAVYRGGVLGGIAELPDAALPVAVEQGSVEQQALDLACHGTLPDPEDAAD